LGIRHIKGISGYFNGREVKSEAGKNWKVGNRKGEIGKPEIIKSGSYQRKNGKVSKWDIENMRKASGVVSDSL